MDEKSQELGNNFHKFQKWPDWRELSKCAWDLRLEGLEDSRIMKNLCENSRYIGQIWSNVHRCNRTVYSRSGATPLQQQDCLRVISFLTFHMWSNTAATHIRTGLWTVNRRLLVDNFLLYPRINWASGGREIIHTYYVDKLGNQISEMARFWWEWEKKTCGFNFRNMRLKTWDLRDWRTRESILAKIQDMPDLEQHRHSRTAVYSRSGATPLEQDCCLRFISFGRFQMWSNTAATGLRTGHSLGSGTQHIPDLEQHPYHIGVNSFARFDHPDMKQHRCYGTLYGSIRYYLNITTIFCPFSALPLSCNTWHRLHLTLRNDFILRKMYYKPDIY